MTRRFSLDSNRLNLLLGYSLLTQEEIVIVSPWLSDLEITFPYNEHIESKKMSLSRALRKFGNKDITLIVGQNEHNRYILSRIPDSVEVMKKENLHTKALVTEDFRYTGSANFTLNATTQNLEYCEISENEFPTAREFVSDELQLSSHS